MESRLFPVPTFINGTGTGSDATVYPHRSSNRNLVFMIGAAPALQRRRISVTCAVSNSQQNHYAVLGVSAEATTSDIKKAYRLLARKYHPDVNKDSQASEIFKGIHLAYEVLSNNTTRHKYDNTLSNKRHLFTQVLKFTFLSIFLLKTIGVKLLLTLSSLMALLDPKLHGGYKVGLRNCMVFGG